MCKAWWLYQLFHGRKHLLNTGVRISPFIEHKINDHDGDVTPPLHILCYTNTSFNDSMIFMFENSLSSDTIHGIWEGGLASPYLSG